MRMGAHILTCISFATGLGAVVSQGSENLFSAISDESSDPIMDLLYQSGPEIHSSTGPFQGPAQPEEDPILDLVHLTSFVDERGSFVEAVRYSQPCPVPSHLSWLVQSARDDGKFEWSLACLFFVTHTLIAMVFFRMLDRYNEKHPVAIRSPLMLKISAITGTVALLVTWFSPYIPQFGAETRLSHFTWAMAVTVPSVILPHVFRALRLRSLFQRHQLILTSSQKCEANLPQDFRAKLFDFEEKVLQFHSSCSEHTRTAWLVFLLASVLGNGIMWETFQTPCHLAQTTAMWGLATPCLILAIIAVGLSFSLAGASELHCVKCEVFALMGSYLLLVKLLYGFASWYRVLVSAWTVLSLALPLACMMCNICKKQVLDWLSPHCGEPCDFVKFFHSPIYRAYFQEFLAVSFHPELFQCWNDLEDYRRQFESEVCPSKMPAGDQNSAAAASMVRARSTSRLDHAGKMRVTARNIFNKYIREDALMHVELCDTVTQEVNYRLHSNNVTAYTFVAAQEEVFSLMAAHYADFVCHPLSSGCFSRTQKRHFAPHPM